MDIKWLHTFIKAAQYENYRKTAELLFISQPTVTLHIKNLEEYLDTNLFRKEGRNIFLTKEGNLFLPYAKKMVDLHDTGLNKLINWKQGYDKNLTVAVAPYIASRIFPSFLKQYFKQNPNIDVTVNVTKSPDIGIEVSNGNADIGISSMVPYQSHLSYECIQEDEVILVVPQNDLYKDLQCDDFFINKYKLFTYNHPVYWDELLPRIQTLYPKVRTMKVTQVEITKQFIKAGLGISFLPKSVVNEEIKQASMMAIETSKFELPYSKTYFVTKGESPEIEHFNIALKNYLNNQI